MTDNFERALGERLLARSEVSPRDVEALRLFARTLPARPSFWRRPMIAWPVRAAAAAVVVLAVAVAVPPLLRNLPGAGGEPSGSPVPTTPVVTPEPVASPVPASPTPAPTQSAGIGSIPLLTASGSNVTLVMDDPDGLIARLEAEQGQATMSVRWYEAMVEDGPYPNSVRITWVGFPRDEVVQVQASRSQDGFLVLHIVQANPPLNSDGEGEDRVLIVQLSDAIDRADVQVTFETTT